MAGLPRVQRVEWIEDYSGACFGAVISQITTLKIFEFRLALDLTVKYLARKERLLTGLNLFFNQFFSTYN